MTDLIDEEDLNDIITDPFFDTYIETLQVLYDLGIEFTFKQRIPIFEVYTFLDKLRAACPPESGTYADIEYAKECLGTLRRLMARGIEPEHVNGVYV